jgi:hypothetical protein
LPAALPTNPQESTAGRERGLPGAGVPQPLPAIANSQQRDIARGPGQLPAGIPYGPPQPGNTQAMVAGHARAVPGSVGSQPPPPAGYAQQPGVGRENEQLPASGLSPASPPARTRVLVVGQGRGNALGASAPTQQQPSAIQPGNAQLQQLIATPEQRMTLNAGTAIHFSDVEVRVLWVYSNINNRLQGTHAEKEIFPDGQGE